MTREQQNENWLRATPAFRAEVSREYRASLETPTAYNMIAADILRRFFGHDNLTSDAEVEETISISRKRVQELHSFYEREYITEKNGSVNKFSLCARTSMLEELFGSKCLPDAPSSAPSNVPSSDDNAEPHPEKYPKISQTSSNCDISDCNSNAHEELYDALFALESASKTVRQALRCKSLITSSHEQIQPV